MPDIDLLPFPVAHPLHYVRDESLSVRDRIHNAQFGAYQAVRTTALLLLADYLATDVASPRVSEAVRGLRLPHWGEWVALCTTIAKFWRGDFPESRPDHPTRFPSLVGGWLDGVWAKNLPAESPWRPLLKGLPGGRGLGSTGPATNAIDAFWTVRNRRAHGEGTLTADAEKDRALLARLHPLLERTLETLFPAGAFSLYRCVTPGAEDVIRLHGPHPGLYFDAEAIGEEWETAFEGTDVVALTDTEAIPIHPLFLAFDPDTPCEAGGSGGLIEDLFLIDGLSEKKVVGLGVLSWKTLPDQLSRSVRERFQAKQVEFGLARRDTRPWMLVDWAAARAARKIAGLTGTKYFPPFYLERVGVDDAFRRAVGLDRPESDLEAGVETDVGRAVLLLGEAGSGKSSLIARLVSGLLPDDDSREVQPAKPAGSGKTHALDPGRDIDAYIGKRGGTDVVFYLAGADSYLRDASLSPDTLLCESITSVGEVRRGSFTSLADFCRHLAPFVRKDFNRRRRVWIVLDALNEADRFTDLVTALDSFLPEVSQYPWLRLIVSVRSGAYFSLARRDESRLTEGSVVFRNTYAWAPFPAPGEPSQRHAPSHIPYLDLRPFRIEGEGEAAYRLRQSAEGQRSCRVRWDHIDRSLRELLLSPLHLHLFHEAFSGADRVASDLSEATLLDAYLDHLEDRLSGLTARLLQMGEVMLTTRRALLPIDLAERWNEEWRRGASCAAQLLAKLDPVEELVSASVLMRPVEEGEGLERRAVGYQFSHQKLAEAVLRRALLRALQPRSAPSLPDILRWAQPAPKDPGTSPSVFEELLGALEGFVGQLSASGDGSSVAALLDLNDDAVRNRLFRAGLEAFAHLYGSEGEPPPESRRFLSEFENALSVQQRSERIGPAIWSVLARLERTGLSRAASVLNKRWLWAIRPLVALHPDRLPLRHGLALSLNRLSRFLEASGNPEDALSFSQESLAIMRELVAREPDRLSLRYSLTLSLNRHSKLLETFGKPDTARRLASDSLDLLRDLVAREPDRLDWRHDLSASLGRLSSFFVAPTDLESGRALAQESVALMRDLVAREPGRLDWRHSLAASLHCLLRFLVGPEGSADTRALIHEFLALMRDLVAREPDRRDWRHDLSTALRQLSDFLRTIGAIEDARGPARESLQILRDLVARDPERLDWRRDLSVSLSRLSDLFAASGDQESAYRLSLESAELTRDIDARVTRDRQLFTYGNNPPYS